MVSPTDEMVDDELEEEPQPKAAAKSKFPCDYCEMGFPNALVRYQHKKKEHPQEVAEKEAEDVDETRQKEMTRMSGGINPDELTENAKAFIEAMDAAAPGLTGQRRKTLIKAYDQELPETDRDMEDFLHDYAMSPGQIRIISRTMFPKRGRDRADNGWGGGGQSVMAMDPATGRQMPIIIMGGNDNHQQPAGPIILQAPAAEAPRESMTKEDVATEVQRVISGEIAKLTAAQPKDTGPVMRKYQEPALNPDGEMMLDGNGNVVMRWIEEPASGTPSLEKMIELMTKFGGFGQQPKVIDAEEIASKVTAALPAPVPVTDPKVAELTDKMTELSHKLEMKDEVEKAVEGATAMVLANVKPQLEELSALQGRQGLNDHQADLAHEEKLATTVMQTIAQNMTSIREDLRPLVMTQAASGLRQQGFGPQAIADMIAGHTAPETATPQSMGAAAAREKWAKP